MKSEDTVLLIGAAVIAWIIFQIPRRPTTTSSSSSSKPRTGTVTAGGMTFATRPSLYEAGQQLENAWNPASPMTPVGWNDA